MRFIHHRVVTTLLGVIENIQQPLLLIIQIKMESEGNVVQLNDSA